MQSEPRLYPKPPRRGQSKYKVGTDANLESSYFPEDDHTGTLTSPLYRDMHEVEALLKQSPNKEIETQDRSFALGGSVLINYSSGD